MVPLQATKCRRSAQRRFVLRSGAVAAVGALASGARMVFDPKGGWAMDAEVLRPQTLQTLVCAARDLHRDFQRSDADYARAVKELDTAAKAEPSLAVLFEDGVGQLDRLARQRFSKAYFAVPGEAARMAILRTLGTTPFLHQFKERLSLAFRRLGGSSPLIAANGAWMATDDWPDLVAEAASGRSPAEKTLVGV